MGPAARAETFIKNPRLAAAETMHRLWGPVALVLAVLGVLWYLVFGLLYGRWTDVGVYSVTVMLLGFGLAGYWASQHMEDETSA